jgi:hypothetical protein
MPLDPHSYLRILSDKFTPVRDNQGALLGCIPRVPDGLDMLADSNGTIFDISWAVQPCIRCDLATQSPASLDGFIPLDDTDADLALPATIPSDDPDLGEAP